MKERESGAESVLSENRSTWRCYPEEGKELLLQGKSGARSITTV